MNGTWHLVLACTKIAHVWNFNGSRLLTFIEKESSVEFKPYAFTASAGVATAKGDHEVIAIGSNFGEIYFVENSTGSYSKKDVARLKTEDPIVAMASCKDTLAVASATGSITLFKCEGLGALEMSSIIDSPDSVPISCL